MSKKLEKMMKDLPSQKVTGKEKEARLEQELETLKIANKYIGSVSINNHSFNKDDSLTFEQKLNIIDALGDYAYIIDINDLSPNPDYEELEELMGNFDNKFSEKYIESLVKGKDILGDIAYKNEKGVGVTYLEVFQSGLVLTGNGLSLGDQPPILLVLTLQKALLSKYFIKHNIKELSESDEKEITVINYLPTLE